MIDAVEPPEASYFPPAAFDWKTTTSLAVMHVLTVPSEFPLPARDAMRYVLIAAADRYLAAQKAAAWGQVYNPPRRDLRLGLESPAPAERGRSGHRLGHHRGRSLPAGRAGGDGLHLRPQRAEPQLRHRIRHPVRAEPAFPLVCRRAEPGLAASAQGARWRAGRIRRSRTRWHSGCCRAASRSSATSTTSRAGRRTKSPSTGTPRWCRSRRCCATCSDQPASPRRTRFSPATTRTASVALRNSA